MNEEMRHPYDQCKIGGRLEISAMKRSSESSSVNLGTIGVRGGRVWSKRKRNNNVSSFYMFSSPRSNSKQTGCSLFEASHLPVNWLRACVSLHWLRACVSMHWLRAFVREYWLPACMCEYWLRACVSVHWLRAFVREYWLPAFVREYWLPACMCEY
jgi:hypothetical protein